jgi:glycosyltransferase involved in cell wall biosynthesis
MKVLLVNAYAKSGGSSVVLRRLCSALNGIGTETHFLVQNTEGLTSADLLVTTDRWAARRPLLDMLPVLPWRNRRSPHWGNAWLDNGATAKAIRDFAPDVTHLHWVNHGMLSLRDVACLQGPVVWTLHDSWVFTGGCHSPQECEGFRKNCGRCPELNSRREHDLSRWNWKRKKAAWGKADFKVVTPSRWLAGAAKNSSLLEGRCIEVIPNAVDTSIFHPVDRTSARATLGLPLDAPLFLFGAHGALTDWNKGMDLWCKALPVVAEEIPSAESMLAGTPMGTLGRAPLPVHELGILTAERMALAMAAADVVVVPSRMENLPTMVAESLACGTPVVAFATGGIPEMVRSGETGFLAQPHDAADLAKGICELLTRGGAMRKACAAFAQDAYAPETIARRHMDLYDSLIERKHDRRN